MGSVQCGGDQGSDRLLSSLWTRVVLLRPGPYAEGVVEFSKLRRDSAVTAAALEDCDVYDPHGAAGEGGEPPVVAQMAAGDRCFLLRDAFAGGAAALRFGLGDRVECCVSTESGMQWQPGHVVGLWYYEEGWSQLAPYQVRLDGSPGQHIFAPRDVADMVREFDERARACGVFSLGPRPGEDLARGMRVTYTGGGRWGSDVQMEDGWTLTVGCEGVIVNCHGRDRQCGVWPLDVSFSRSGVVPSSQPGPHSDGAGSVEGFSPPSDGILLAMTPLDVRPLPDGSSPPRRRLEGF